MEAPEEPPDPRWDERAVLRALDWFEKAPGDALVGQEALRGLTLGELRVMFGATPDDPDDPPMFDNYEVGPRHVERVQAAVDHFIDLDRFDYFVAAYQRDSWTR